MGKRYKAGNVGRKKKKSKPKIFLVREQRINELIKEFKEITKKDMDNLENYDEANRLRLDIKMAFDMQGKEIYRYGRRRRNIYYDQLEKFKRIYTHWKNKSQKSYTIRRYHIPEHLIANLEYYTMTGISDVRQLF